MTRSTPPIAVGGLYFSVADLPEAEEDCFRADWGNFLTPAGSELDADVVVIPFGSGWTSVEAAIRRRLSRLAAEKGGLFLHGAGLLGPTGAWCFLGPSGAGKTTLAAPHPDEVFLGDENLLLLPESDGGWLLHPVPISSTPPRYPRRSRPCPVAGVAFLVQGARDAWEPLPAAEALPRILASTYLEEETGAGLFLEAAADLTAAVPCGTLCFRKGQSFWQVLPGAATREPRPRCLPTSTRASW